MDRAEILVAIAGLCLIAFVVWYFFGERDRPKAGESNHKTAQNGTK